jgi:hypothetical protein
MMWGLMRTDQLAIATILAVFAATMFLATNLFVSTKSAKAFLSLGQVRITNGVSAGQVWAERTSTVPLY